MTIFFQKFIFIFLFFIFQINFSEFFFEKFFFQENFEKINFTQKNFSEINVNSFHAFHFTKTEISFDEHNATLNMTMHVFIDDLEKALQLKSKEKLFLGTEKENKEANKAIENYLQKNFSLEIDNKKVIYNWVGKENTHDMQAIYIYLSVEKIKKFKQIRFNNTLMVEVFKDQKNIVQLNLPNKPQGYFVFDRSHGQWTMDN